MQIDFDEIKRILAVFIEAPTPFITLKDLDFFSVEGEDADKLVFHLLLLVENGLISNCKLETGNPEFIGLVITNWNIGGGEIPIRLTQDGHDFASALNQQPIFERVKKELAEAPFEVVKDVSKRWLGKLMKDKLGLE
ncbi:DUF2513 domain-containing protein [Serratia symbiotica]|uniref:DUF2513 domain-containing protein n=1 Tax=Serratia symbiotica TaxID=138074 RepID=UPI00346403FF